VFVSALFRSSYLHFPGFLFGIRSSRIINEKLPVDSALTKFAQTDTDCGIGVHHRLHSRRGQKYLTYIWNKV